MKRSALVFGWVALALGAALGQAPTEPATGGADAVAPAAVEGVAPTAGQEPPGAGEKAVAQGEKKLRDPFRPFTLDLRPKEDEEPLTPLQRYELAQLRVSAILLNLIPPRALLEDNSGMGFVVIPGTPIGRRRGVVRVIEPGRVVVEEKTLDFYGREQAKQVVMEMEKETEVPGGSQEKR